MRMRLTTADALESRMLLSGSTAGISIAEVNTTNGLFTTQVPLPAGAENGQMLEIVSPPANGSAYIQYGYHATPGPSDQIIYVASGTGGNETFTVDTFTVRLRDNSGNLMLHTIQVNNADSSRYSTTTGSGYTTSYSYGSGSGSGWGGSGSGSGSGSNVAPTAEQGSIYTVHTQPTTGQFSGWDSDNDLLSITVSGSSLGSFTWGNTYKDPGDASRTFRDYLFTPNAGPGGVGSEILTLAVSDGEFSSTSNVYVDVWNNLPIPQADPVYMMHDEVFTGNLSSNDFDIYWQGDHWVDGDGDTVTFMLVASPSHGVLETFNATTGEFTYRPNAGYVSTPNEEFFTYTLTDGIESYATPALVSIDVGNQAPVAEYDSGFDWLNPTTGQTQWVNYFVLEGNTLSVSATDGVLKNDTDPDPTDRDTLEAEIMQPATYGTAALAADGSFTYTPNQSVFDDPNFSGLTDVFTYQTKDRHGDWSGEVEVYVDLATFVILKESWFEGNFDYVPLDAISYEPWVGEEIALRAEIKGSIGAPIRYQWGIGGTRVKGYTQTDGTNVNDRSTSARVQSVEAEDLTQSQVAFFWVDGGEKLASAQITSLGMTLTQSSVFSVRRPDISWTADTNAIEYVSGAQAVAIFGNPLASNVADRKGIVTHLAINNDENSRGEFEFTQTVSSKSSRLFNGVQQFREGYGVDGDFSYGSRYGDGFEDSPLTRLDQSGATTALSRTDGFVAYVMFNPSLHIFDEFSGRHSIFVPVKSLQWNIHWSLTFSPEANGKWILNEKSGSEEMHIIGTGTTSFPEFDFAITHFINENSWQTM